VHRHRHEQGGNLENQAGEKAERIVEEIGHPLLEAPEVGDSESEDSRAPAMR
jgi:hypothetical protein